MRTGVKSPISILVAVAAGLTVLLGYFVDLPVLANLRAMLLRWAVILAAVALLVGLANLVTVHWRKVANRQEGNVYSLILIIALCLTLIVVGFFGPTAPWSLWIFNYIQVPIESSLMALLAVILPYAAARMLNRRINLFSIIFVITVLVGLVGMAAISGFELPLFGDLRNWIMQVPAVAGARGILLGVALGTVATGLRIFMGADRPYEG